MIAPGQVRVWSMFNDGVPWAKYFVLSCDANEYDTEYTLIILETSHPMSGMEPGVQLSYGSLASMLTDSTVVPL